MKFKLIIALLLVFAGGMVCFLIKGLVINLVTSVKEDKVVKVQPEKQTIPKQVERPKYTQSEIQSAREYIGNYRYIQREINKLALKCIVDNPDQDPKSCDIAAKRRYNMSTDPESIRQIEYKYRQQLEVANSKE